MSELSRRAGFLSGSGPRSDAIYVLERNLE